jgi:hypothetical protein
MTKVKQALKAYTPFVSVLFLALVILFTQPQKMSEEQVMELAPFELLQVNGQNVYVKYMTGEYNCLRILYINEYGEVFQVEHLEDCSHLKLLMYENKR